ncbi:chromosome segregation protein SMC [bacterium]|nr:chromosome segregation protein SMC [bacterium]
MYLKRLEMRGFKTFADKSELEFHPGVSAIVGPNGVGKSNVTDAILWALGEQSAKTLRTENLQDVIFVGSERRRQLNMAEVHLTLDNSDRTLPTEFSEVVISRRIFRAGDSEYLINNTACRLKDVRELLLDTGVGPKAYSVVGQGEIDAILSIRGEDRRELLEEVAGVRKYRVRRTEAERKLEATEINLTRVADIVHELRSQREPLEQQAERARAYKTLDEKLQSLELYLLGADYRRHAEKRGQLANEVAVATADLQITRNLMSELDAEHQKLQALSLSLENELEKLRLEALRLQRVATEARERRAVNLERQRTLTARQETLDEALAEHRRRQESLSQQNDALQAERQALQDRLGSEDKGLREQQSEYDRRRNAAQQQQQRAQQMEEQRVKTLQQIARLENEAAALASLQADLQERIGRLESQREQFEERREAVEAQAGEYEDGMQALQTALQETIARQQEAEADVAYVQGVVRDQNQKRNILAEAVSALESRRRVLQELRDSYEGFEEGARQVMQAVSEGKLSGVRGLLAEALDVPQKFEVAIEAALGDKLQWVLCHTQDDALRGIEYLRANTLGRAAFLPLTLGARHAAEPINTSGLRSGCLGIAAKLIKVDRQVGAPVEAILSRIVICSDLEAAVDTFHRLNGRCTVATLAGEVLEPEGAVYGGVMEGGAGQEFGRQRELDTLDERIEELKTWLGRMYRVDEQLEAEVNQRRQLAAEAVEQVNQLRSDLRQQEGEVKHQQDQIRAAVEAAGEMAQEIKRLQQRLQESAERQQDTLQQAETARGRIAELQQEIEQARQQAGTAAERETLRQALTERQVLVAELRQQIAANQGLCERAAADLQQATAARQAAENELTHIAAELKRIEAELSQGSDEAANLERAAALETEADEKAEQLAHLRDKVAEADAKRRELSQAQEQQTERLHVADLALARAEANLQAVTERLQDIYQMPIEQALDVKLEGMSESQARREAAQLRSEMRNLGSVNLGSIEECERLRARETFLENQQNDLIAAKTDLLQVIAELDEAAQAAFMETFERVGVEFDEIFKRLFGGGDTQLALSAPEDPLNSGVDVIVTPPGKKQQNLLLLSGGERAMTALALLFALLRVKPSPFCVMDEIDAALDAANTDRFADMLREFAERSQFIVITHNPRTMEKADVLHGITMQEPGCSKLISVELEQAQKEAEQRQAAG